jgi:hypothetical protein
MPIGMPMAIHQHNLAPNNWYGETTQQAIGRQNADRNATFNDARAATDAFKPTAGPSDMFWVMESDGVDKTLMSFATIDTFNDGRWMVDHADGTAYYLRGHPL